MVGTVWDVVVGSAVDDDGEGVVESRTEEVVEITDGGGAIDVSKES